MKAQRANRFTILLAVAFASLVILPRHPFAAEKQQIKVRIVDSATGAPINGAEVYVRMAGDPGLKRVGVTTNGMSRFEPPNGDRMIEYRVEARGYRDRTMLVTVDESKVTEITLDANDFQLKGMVVGPGGQMIPGAKIAMMIGDHPVVLEANARVRAGFVDPFHFSTATVIALGDGSFSTAAPTGTATIVAVHDAGCGSTTVKGWTNGAVVQLRPWATLRGRMLINGRPAINRTVVAIMCNFFNSNARMYLRNFEATTDAEGKFFFDRLPPGVIEVVQKADIGGGRSAYSHWASFVADATLPQNDAVYSLEGREVRGTIAKADAAADWRGMSFVGALISRSTRQMSEFEPLAGGSAGRPTQIFALTINGDGEFSGDAIPPGEYSLNVNCIEQNRSRGQFSGRVVVPPGDGLLKMGQVTVTNITK